MFKREIDKIKGSVFLRNFTALATGEFAAHAINMFINILVARYLAPEQYGNYSLIMTYISLFYVVASLGLRQIVIRDISRSQTNSSYYFKMSMLLRLLGLVIAFVCVLGYSILFHKGIAFLFLLFVMVGVTTQSLWDGLQAVAFGMQKMKSTSIINVLFSVMMLLGCFLVPKEYFTFNNILVLYFSIFILKDIIYYITIKHEKLLTSNVGNTTIDFFDLKKLFNDSLPYYVLSIFTLFSSQFPILFLEKNSVITEVAYFNTANKLLLPMTLFMNTAMTALFPNQSQLYAKDKLKFSLKAKQIFTYLVLFGMFACFGISLFKDEIVYLLYGNEYASTGDVMAFQCWYLALLAVFCFIGGTFGAADRQKLVATTSILYAILSTPILYISSYYGAVGLAVGYIVASFVNMSYNFYYFRKVTNNKITIRYLLNMMLMFLLAFLVVYALNQLMLPLFVRISIFVLICFVIYLFYRRKKYDRPF